MADLRQTEKKKALVLAYPSFGRAICRALEDFGQLQCTCPLIVPLGKHAADGVDTEAWLDQLRQMLIPGASPDLQRPSFFEWPRFDFIILQDLWLEAGQSLGYVGAVLAALDFYERANFSTRKVVVVTDCDYPYDPSAPSAAAWADVQHEFDAKNMILWLKWHDDDFLSQMVRHLSDQFRPEKLDVAHHALWAEDLVAEHRTKTSNGTRLQDFIRKFADLIVVDDEPQQLRLAYKGLTGGDPPDTVDEVGQAPLWAIVRTADGKVEGLSFEDYDSLEEFCLNRIERTANAGRYTILVTDMLFRGVPSRTGVSLIRAARSRPVPRHQLGVIVLTGFSSATVLMSGYQYGADFMISKSFRLDASRSHRHADLSDMAIHRVLIAAVTLCFQKLWLKHTREALRKRTPARPSRLVLEDLRKVLAREVVAQSLLEEWEDTDYLAFAAVAYGANSRAQTEWKAALDRAQRYDAMPDAD